MGGTVRVIETRFTEDELEIRDESGDVVELADIPYDDEHTTTTEYDGLTAREAVDR